MIDPQSVRSKSLHHVAYATRDPEATYRFYHDKLGMRLAHTENHRQGDGWFRHFFFDMGSGDMLAFFAIDDVGEKPDYKTQVSLGLGLPIWVNHIAFRLDSEDELEAMTKRLKHLGVEHMHEIDHGWCRSIYTVDPNGIMVEFCVTTDVPAFTQTEEEALRLLRLPAHQFDETSRKEKDVAVEV